MWGDLKNTVCLRNTRTQQDLWQKIAIVFVAIQLATLPEVGHSVAHYYQQFTGAGGGYFEHL
jgi:hypothetical protein